MPWIHRQMTYVCRCIFGHRSVRPKRLSNCIPCWIYKTISRFHPHFRWQIARCEHTGPADSRNRRILHHGSRISGFTLAQVLNMIGSNFVLCAEKNTRYQRHNRSTAPPVPLTIAELYKNRWQVELFFKWIKQHLRVKSFYGNSEYAVRSQLRIAISVYVLCTIIRKKSQLELSLCTIMQVFSLTLFERIRLNQILTDTEYTSEMDDFPIQLKLSEKTLGH